MCTGGKVIHNILKIWVCVAHWVSFWAQISQARDLFPQIFRKNRLGLAENSLKIVKKWVGFC